jgi:hypothetical protein
VEKVWEKKVPNNMHGNTADWLGLLVSFQVGALPLLVIINESQQKPTTTEKSTLRYKVTR